MSYPYPLLINSLFYNPKNNKAQSSYESVASIIGISPTSLQPLQYSDYETYQFSAPRVFRFDQAGSRLKARVCCDSVESNSVFVRISHAYNYGLPVAKPIGVMQNIVLLSYIEGSVVQNFSPEDVITIAQLHSRVVATPIGEQDKTAVIELMNNLVYTCLTELCAMTSRSVYSRLVELADDLPQVMPVFDHQDFGRHNLIRSDSNELYLIDEEAFGVIPFGYSIVRAIYERDNYRITTSEHLERYLREFPVQLADYYKENELFLRILFIIRNAVRRRMMGNVEGSNRLLREIDQLL